MDNAPPPPSSPPPPPSSTPPPESGEKDTEVSTTSSGTSNEAVDAAKTKADDDNDNAGATSTSATPQLQVIGAGFGRCGTASTKEALQILGWNKENENATYHMFELVTATNQEEHMDAWIEFGETRDVKALELPLRGYGATVDWPACEAYKELLAANPHALVLLNVRDPEKWWKSVSETIGPHSKLWLWLFHVTGVRSRKFTKMVHSLIWDGKFDGKFYDKEHAIKVFNEHIEEVKRVVPENQLLVFSVKDGWGPLCAFLKRPVPEQEFPYVNSGDAFKQRIFKSKVTAVARLGGAVLLGAVVGLTLWKVIKK